MTRILTITLGTLWAVGLVFTALWMWQRCDDIAVYLRAGNPVLAHAALRCGAVAAFAMGQAVLLTFVIGGALGAKGRDATMQALRLSAVVVFLFAATSAIALGAACR